MKIFFFYENRTAMYKKVPEERKRSKNKFAIRSILKEKDGKRS